MVKCAIKTVIYKFHEKFGTTSPTHIWDFFRRHLFGRNTSASPHLLISNVIRLSPQVLQLSAGRCQPAGRGPRRGAWRQVLQTLGLRPLVWSWGNSNHPHLNPPPQDTRPLGVESEMRRLLAENWSPAPDRIRDSGGGRGGDYISSHLPRQADYIIGHNDTQTLPGLSFDDHISQSNLQCRPIFVHCGCLSWENNIWIFATKT